ncbi:putative nuclease HARBI1 [Antennarius striatus]|uniref:putative nuclease HARBI1 n=1 Tax=Antennarius striatus TaxID=241820 RepID=UPI0035B14766
MACPFQDDPVHEGAAFLRRELRLRRERIYRPRLDVMSFPDTYLYERYRFTSGTIVYIHDLIRPYIGSRTNRSRAVTSKQVLCAALRFYTTGTFLYIVGDAQHPRFPNVIGCIDGTHIPIKAPSQDDGAFVNRKSVHSINVQIIFDAEYRITNVVAKWPGSVHDSRIYREFDGVLLGDRAYPCQPWLLPPYPDPEPGPRQNFNRAHCRTRARVEMTIGLLKARFQCLHHLTTTPERACDTIVACVVLHKIATIRGEQHPAPQINDPDDNPIHLPAVQEGRAVGDYICENYFSN